VKKKKSKKNKKKSHKKKSHKKDDSLIDATDEGDIAKKEASIITKTVASKLD